MDIKLDTGSRIPVGSPGGPVEVPSAPATEDELRMVAAKSGNAVKVAVQTTDWPSVDPYLEEEIYERQKARSERDVREPRIREQYPVYGDPSREPGTPYAKTTENTLKMAFEDALSEGHTWRDALDLLYKGDFGGLRWAYLPEWRKEQDWEPFAEMVEDRIRELYEESGAEYTPGRSDWPLEIPEEGPLEEADYGGRGGLPALYKEDPDPGRGSGESDWAARMRHRLERKMEVRTPWNKPRPPEPRPPEPRSEASERESRGWGAHASKSRNVVRVAGFGEDDPEIQAGEGPAGVRSYGDREEMIRRISTLEVLSENLYRRLVSIRDMQMRHGEKPSAEYLQLIAKDVLDTVDSVWPDESRRMASSGAVVKVAGFDS